MANLFAIYATTKNGDTDFAGLTLGTVTASTDWAMGGFNLTGLPSTPSGSTAATSKAYVDSVASGLDVKGSSRVATAGVLPANTRTGNVLLADVNGALNDTGIDGVTTLLDDDRVLVKNEATGANNGLYFISDLGSAGTKWELTRTTDADTSAEVTDVMFTFISEGSTNADQGWVLTTNDPITLNTTALSFSQFSGAGSFTAGDGISITGNTVAVDLTDAADDGLEFSGGDLTASLAGSGNAGVIRLTDDLGGSATSPDVIGITGSAGIATLRAALSSIQSARSDGVGVTFNYSGAGAAGGGGWSFNGQNGTGAGAGGGFAVQGGTGGGTDGAGGSASLTAGDGGITNGNGGTVTINGGAATGTGTSGDINLNIRSTGTTDGLINFQEDGTTRLTWDLSASVVQKIASTAGDFSINYSAASGTGVGSNISIAAQQGLAGSAGGTASLTAGAGNTTGAGGAVTVSAGAAGASGNGGGATLQATDAGSATGTGGSVNITSGNATGAGTGGDITLNAGSTVGGTDGKVKTQIGSTDLWSTYFFTAFTAGIDFNPSMNGAIGYTVANAGAGADLSLEGQDAGGGADSGGGSINATAGDGINSGAGGSVSLFGGSSGPNAGGTAIGGGINISAGTGAGSGDSVGGLVELNGGTGGATGDGGAITLTAGAGGGTAAGGANGGAINLTAGAATVGSGGYGGAVTITAGAGDGAGTTGTGGNVFIVGGNGGATANGGVAILSGGNGGGTSGNGGAAELNGGNAAFEGDGGRVVIRGRNATTDTDAARTGGTVTITAGNSKGTATGAAIGITAGNGTGTGALVADGGAITLTAGNAGGGGGAADGGDIILNPGTAVGAGIAGAVIVNGKLTVTGIIDPTGLVLNAQGAVPGTDPPGSGKGTVWVKTGTPTTMWFTDSAGGDFQLEYAGGGGSETLAQTLVLGNLTGGTDIVVTGATVIRGDDGASPVALILRGGNATSGDTAGVAASLTAGAGNGTGNAGSLTLSAGAAGATGTGGNVTISASAGGGASNNGGSVTINGGAGGSSATSGNIILNVEGEGTDGSIVFQKDTNPFMTFIHGTLDTTSTTLTAVGGANFAVTADRSATIFVQVTGRNGTSANSAGYLLFGTFENTGGTLTQKGSTAVIAQNEEAAAFDASLAVNGTNIEVQVANDAANSTLWQVSGWAMQNAA